MLKRTLYVMVAGLCLGACASTPPPPPPAPEPPPVVISDQPEPVSESVPEPPPPPPTPARPQQTDAGRFRVGVASLETAEATAPWVSKLQAAGYRTEVLPVEIEGKTWHRVLLPGYANLEEARAVVPIVEQEFGITGVWVTSRRRAPGPAGEAAPAPAQAPAAAEPAATQPPETTVEIPVQEPPAN